MLDVTASGHPLMHAYFSTTRSREKKVVSIVVLHIFNGFIWQHLTATGWSLSKPALDMLTLLKHTYVFVFLVISQHWDDTCSSDPSSSKTRILYSIYHGRLRPGDARSQGISSYVTDLVLTKVSGFSIIKFKYQIKSTHLEGGVAW